MNGGHILPAPLSWRLFAFSTRRKVTQTLKGSGRASGRIFAFSDCIRRSFWKAIHKPYRASTSRPTETLPQLVRADGAPASVPWRRRMIPSACGTCVPTVCLWCWDSILPTCCVCHADTVVSASEDGTIKVWDVGSRSLRCEISLGQFTINVDTVDFAHGGGHHAIANGTPGFRAPPRESRSLGGRIPIPGGCGPKMFMAARRVRNGTRNGAILLLSRGLMYGLLH
jgi:hypothetical protein